MADTSAVVKVEGLRELTRFLRSLPGEVQDELKNIHTRVAQPVYREAVVQVPRRSGALGQTIRVATGRKSSALIRAGKRSVPYAGPIHYGWPARNIRPQPFLTKPLRQKQPQVLLDYRSELSRLMLSVGRQTRIF